MKKQERKEAKSSNRLSEAMSERTKRKSGGAQNKNAAFLFGQFVLKFGRVGSHNKKSGIMSDK